jgi:hypothetical protein
VFVPGFTWGPEGVSCLGSSAGPFGGYLGGEKCARVHRAGDHRT